MDPKLRAQIAAALSAPSDPMAQWSSDPLNPGIDLIQLNQLSPALMEALQRQPSQGEMLVQHWGERPTMFAEDMIKGMLSPFFETGKRIGKNIANYDPSRPPVSQLLDAEAITPAAQMASQYVPGGSLSDATFGTGEGYPSMVENWKQGNFGAVAGQAQGAFADAALAVSPMMAIILGLGNDATRQALEAIKNADAAPETAGRYSTDPEAINNIWKDFGVMQGPDARLYKEYPDTYEIPTLRELEDIADARSKSTGKEVYDSMRLGDLMPNRGDTLFEDVPGFAETPLRLYDDWPMQQRGSTAGDASYVALNAHGSPEATVSHEGTHLANMLAKTGAEGGDPGNFTRGNQWYEPETANRAKTYGIDDPMEAYQSLWGETFARMAGARRERFLQDEEWPTNSPIYDIDVYPGATFARPTEQTGNEMLAPFKNLWWDPEARKAAQDAADAEAQRVWQEMEATRPKVPQSSLAGHNGGPPMTDEPRYNSDEGLRNFGQLPADELERRGYAPDQRIFDWFNQKPEDVPGWEDAPRPNAPTGYSWQFGQLPKEDLLRDGYPLDARIFDWYLEPTANKTGEAPGGTSDADLPKFQEDVAAGRYSPKMREPQLPATVPPKQQSSILTYHGSPSSTEFTRFDPKKVGTGSGTGEGWGAYSAQEPMVADRYRDWDQEYGKMGTRAYALELPGEPADYLDLHRSFAEQDPAIVAKLETVFGPRPENPEGTLWASMPRDMIGSPNKQAVEPPWMSEQEASRRLYDAGILGSRYKDRKSQAGKADTWNFVNFNVDDPKVLGSTGGDIGELITRFQNAPDKQQMSIAIEGINRRLAAVGNTKTSRGGERFVGAPDGVNTPAQEEALINSLMQRAASGPGIGGKDFYTDYQKAIRGATNDPVKARELATLTGHTSPQTTPEQNHNYAVKGLNQRTTGAQIDTGMFHNTNRKRIEASLDSGRLPDDPKTGQYAYNILPPDLRPEDFSEYAPIAGRTDRPVHDTWDFRAFGYSNENGGTNPQRHAYMDSVYDKVIERLNADPKTRALAGPGGWNVENTQAAVWAAMRGEAMDKGAHAVNEVKDAQTIFDKAKGITQMAAIPGPSTGVDERLLHAPIKQKEAYTKTMFDALKDEDGASVIARSLGLSTPMREGYGPWQGMMEPNRVIDMGVAGEGFGTKGSPADPRGSKAGGPPRQIDPASDLVARTMRRWHQIALGQEGSGFTFPYEKTVTGKTANLGVVEGIPLNGRDDYDRAFQTARKVWGDDFADKVVVQPTMDGTGIMMKDITGDNDAFTKNMKAFSAAMGGGDPRWMKDVGNQFDYVQWNDPSYRGLLDETRDNPALKAIFDRDIIPALAKVQATSEQWARETGISADTVPDRLRSVIIQGGKNWPAAIEAAVKKGIIPAVAGIVAMNAMLNHAGQDGS